MGSYLSQTMWIAKHHMDALLTFSERYRYNVYSERTKMLDTAFPGVK